MVRALLLPLLVLILTAIACTGEVAPSEPASQPSPTMVVGDDDETATTAPVKGQATGEAAGFSLADAERLAREELAAALDIPEAQVDVVESHAQTWPDETLGCEASRRIVVEALPVDGYQIVLAASGATYDYRADGQGRVELCPESEDIGKPLDPIR